MCPGLTCPYRVFRTIVTGGSTKSRRRRVNTCLLKMKMFKAPPPHKYPHIQMQMRALVCSHIKIRILPYCITVHARVRAIIIRHHLLLTLNYWAVTAFKVSPIYLTQPNFLYFTNGYYIVFVCTKTDFFIFISVSLMNSYTNILWHKILHLPLFYSTGSLLLEMYYCFWSFN